MSDLTANMDDTILEKIYRSGLKFLEPVDLYQTHKLVAEEATKLLNADWGALYLAKGREFNRVAVYPENSSIGSLYKPRKRGFTYLAYSKKKTFVVDRNGIVGAHPELLKNGYESAICIPLSYLKKSIGALVLFSNEQHKFSEKELNLLKIFGSYASLAIHRSESYDETKKALEMRDLFISMAAHELRTPLTAVNGYIQLLNTKLSGSNTSESRWVQQLYWESTRLTNLISELLEINRIKTGQLQYIWKECHVKELMKRVVNNFKFSFPDKNLIFDDQYNYENDIVIGDFDKIMQSVTNILDNAVKFSPLEKSIELTLKHQPNFAVIQVKDHGVGISKKDIPKIFEGFYRGDNNYSPEGLGLGLYLVKDIVNRHHGTIKVRSVANRDTIVEVRLPLNKPSTISNGKFS